MKESIFYKPPTFKDRLVSLKYCIIFWKGRSKGIAYTRDIKLDEKQKSTTSCLDNIT